MITLYTAPSCPLCVLAKEKLNEKGLQFESRDLRTCISEIPEGILTAPVMRCKNGFYHSGMSVIVAIEEDEV